MPEEQDPKGQSGPRGFQIVGEEDAASEEVQTLPPITFGTFVLSLSTSALVHLGEGPSPETGKTDPPNLPLAQQTIDILEMLFQKTRGNLDDDEAHLLEAILHDLRMRYVRARDVKKD
jgi:hypothetical protein